jgi:hypothetical protein
VYQRECARYRRRIDGETAKPPIQADRTQARGPDEGVAGNIVNFERANVTEGGQAVVAGDTVTRGQGGGQAVVAGDTVTRGQGERRRGMIEK